MKCLVWSVALYAAEMWTLTQTDSKRSWLGNVTEEEVLGRVIEVNQQIHLVAFCVKKSSKQPIILTC